MRRHPDLDRVRHPARLLTAALMFAMSPVWCADARGRDIGSRPAGQFDDYVLSLSWVPGFCAIHGLRALECGKKLGFALHGLWPQLTGGDYPTNCSTATLSPGEIQRYQGLYADHSLIAHEWRKHGTCSGLAPAAYFGLTARDTHRVRIPAAYGPGAILRAADAKAVKLAFITANPGLSAGAVTTITTKGMLLEVDICLTKIGDFRSC